MIASLQRQIASLEGVITHLRRELVESRDESALAQPMAAVAAPATTTTTTAKAKTATTTKTTTASKAAASTSRAPATLHPHRLPEARGSVGGLYGIGGVGVAGGGSSRGCRPSDGLSATEAPALRRCAGPRGSYGGTGRDSRADHTGASCTDLPLPPLLAPAKGYPML